MKVSADVFQDDVTGGSYYSVEIEPNEGELDRLGMLNYCPECPLKRSSKPKIARP